MRRLLALVSVVVAGSSSLAAQQQPAERFTLAGPEVAVYDLVGTMRVVGATTGSDVVAEVSRGGPDAAKLKVETGPIGGHQTLRVIFPGDAIVSRDLGRGSTTRLRVRDDGTFGDDTRRGGGIFSRGTEVTISGRGGDGIEAHADVTLRVPAGKRVVVHLAVGDAQVSNVDGDVRVDVAAANVTANDTHGRLSLDTGSGEVRVTDAEGELDLDTGSGDVTLTRVSGKRLTVDAGSGALRGTDVASDVLTLDLGSGGATLANVHSNEISLDSGSGDVDLGLAGDVRSLVVDSGSGDVTIRVPTSLGATIDVDAGSGGVTTDVPITITHKDGSELSGTIGDGNGRIKIDSGSGRVRIRKA